MFFSPSPSELGIKTVSILDVNQKSDMSVSGSILDV